jgi:ligand-binding sensor domain-containing protein
MSYKAFLVFWFSIMNSSVGIAQIPRWIIFNEDNSPLPSNVVNSIVQDQNGVYWIATDAKLLNQAFVGGGLARFDGRTWTVFNTSNSPLPSNRVNFAAVDNSGNVWVATHGAGAAKYDGQDWQIFNRSNSGLPANEVYTIAIEKSGIVWFGMYNDGVARYDGSSWTVYNIRNSGLTSDLINFIVIDSAGAKWIGTEFAGLFSFNGTHWTKPSNGDFFAGINESAIALAIDQKQNKWVGTAGLKGNRLAKFKDSSWTAFDSTTMGFRFAVSYAGIAIDKNDVKWIAGGNGLAKYDDISWTLFPSSNSPIPESKFYAIIVDASGNKVFTACKDSNYIRINYGLVFFNETGVKGIITSVNEKRDDRQLKDFALLQNYPNPFNPATIIKFAVTKTGFATLKVYNPLGQEVAALFSGIAEGNRIYQATFNAATLPSGIYFARLRFGSQSAVRKMVLVGK